MFFNLSNECGLRLIWATIVMATIAFSIYVVLVAWFAFTENPTFISLESQNYPIWNVPYPGVAICSVNKISRKAATKYAQELRIKMRNRTTVEKLLRNIQQFGFLIDPPAAEQGDAMEFQEILDTFDTNGINFFNTTFRMEMLSPKCEDFLLKCKWQGKEFPCDKLFVLDTTSEGYCCLFNYARTTISKGKEPKILRTNASGTENGLIVHLNGSTSDYFYNNRNTVGFVVKIFNSIDFPDSTTGSLVEDILNPSREVYIKLLVSTVLSEESVRQYTSYQRHCFFRNEKRSEYGNYYSSSQCLSKCKVRSVLALCNCIPFYAQFDSRSNDPSMVVCNLAHMPCLSRYRVTWNTYRPEQEGIRGLEQEQEDSLNCPGCLPLCSDTVHSFESASFKIRPLSIDSNRPRQKNTSTTKNLSPNDVSILRIYYATTASLLYKRDVLLTWYEIVANFGGILSLCLGMSIITFVEIFYFMTVQFFENFKLNRINQINEISIKPFDPKSKRLEHEIQQKKINDTIFPYLK